MKSTMSMNRLLSLSMSTVEDMTIRNQKGEALVMSEEGLYTFDYKTMKATPRPLNFDIAKVKRAQFVEAVKGEFFARELAKMNDEFSRFADCDESFFAEAREEYSAEEIARADEIAREARARIDAIRDVLTPKAKESASITVKAVVSAIRAEAMPASLAKPAEAVKDECKRLNAVVNAHFSAEEIARAEAVIKDNENYGTVDVAKAQEMLSLYALSEGETQGVPNVKNLRALVSKFIKALWKECPAEGVQKNNMECNHALSIEVFQRSKNARTLSRKGNVKSNYASADEIAREVVFAVVESLQAKARAEAKAEAKPAKK